MKTLLLYFNLFIFRIMTIRKYRNFLMDPASIRKLYIKLRCNPHLNSVKKGGIVFYNVSKKTRKGALATLPKTVSELVLATLTVSPALALQDPSTGPAVFVDFSTITIGVLCHEIGHHASMKRFGRLWGEQIIRGILGYPVDSIYEKIMEVEMGCDTQYLSSLTRKEIGELIDFLESADWDAADDANQQVGITTTIPLNEIRIQRLRDIYANWWS